MALVIHIGGCFFGPSDEFSAIGTWYPYWQRQIGTMPRYVNKPRISGHDLASATHPRMSSRHEALLPFWPAPPS